MPSGPVVTRRGALAATLTGCARLLAFGDPNPVELAGIRVQLQDVARGLEVAP